MISPGPDGNLWFTESGSNQIGRITTTGTITEFDVSTLNSEPSGIAPGPDGYLWFTERLVNKIGRITTSGKVTEFEVPTADSAPNGITAGASGDMWFTEQLGDKIGRRPVGFTPSEIRSAYAIDQISFDGVTGNGEGQTIAIIDLGHNPTIANDLHQFDVEFQLPDPPSFKVVNDLGQAAPASDGWAIYSGRGS